MRRIALIDADILVYEAAYRCQDTIEWEEGEATVYADFEEAQADFDLSISQIKQDVGAHEEILALTDSDRDANFRRTVWPAYKDHREGPNDGRPLLYKALRGWIREKYVVQEKRGIEGDDTIGILATRMEGVEPIIVSIDKDLDTVPGLHWNWRKPERGVYYVNEHDAFRNFVYQTLVGDSTDNYPGIRGVGPVRASQLLDYWSELPEWAVWEEVEATFEEWGLSKADALTQARCARILQSEDWDTERQCVRLWTPPREETNDG